MTQAARRKAHQPGWTILELAVVLACISVLTTIAMPEFERSLRRARSVEAIATANTIERELIGYYYRFNQYPPAPGGSQNPPDDPSAGLEYWVEGQPGWTDIGFTSGGQAYNFRYEFIPTFDTTTGQYDQVYVHAWTQPAGDPNLNEFYIYLDSGYRVSDVELGD